LCIRFRDIPLKQKLFSTLIFLVILPLFIASLVITFKTSEVLKIKSCETSLQILKQTQQAIVNIIRETDYLSISMLSDDRIQKLSKSETDGISLDTVNMQRELYVSVQTALEAKPYINSVCVSKEDKIIFQYGDLVFTEDKSFFRKALELKGKGFWTPTYTLRDRIKNDANNHVISYIRVINDLDSFEHPIAYQRISIDEGYICRIYSGVNTWEDGDIFIIDSEGKIISSTDKKKIGSNPDKNGAYIGQILKNKQGFFDAVIDSINTSVLYYTIDDVGWHVIQTVPTKDFKAQTATANMIIFVAIAFCILFGILFSIIQTRTIIQPLRIMSREMGKVREGNFNIDLKVISKDEIGSLGTLFIDMVGKIKELIDTVYKSEIKEKESRLKVLEAQINPHFLYNTLDSIHWLAVKNRDYDVSEQIEALSDIFKHVLNKGRQITTIGEEIEYLESYLVIQRSRFGSRMDIGIEVENGLLRYQTLNLILQPLVENAINHGLECKSGNGSINIKILKVDEKIKYIVSDNGVGTDEKRIARMLSSNKESHNVFALKNINDRIQLMYGKEYGLRLYSEEGIGTRVEVYIPALTDENGESAEL